MSEKHTPVLTDEEIEAIADNYVQMWGGHWECEPAIHEDHAEDFARDIEQAVLAKVKPEDKYLKHLKKSSETVAKWPQWKKESLGDMPEVKND